MAIWMSFAAASCLFDELIVAVGVNPDKRELFTLDERVEMITELLKDVPRHAGGEVHGPDRGFCSKSEGDGDPAWDS